MILTSTVVMFVLTYTNVFAFAHIRLSQERAYMAVLMGSGMAVVMITFMWGRMYPSPRVNIGIIVGAFLVGTGAFTMSQAQILVGDVGYMRGMIPHHSIAILTSERANIADLRVRELASQISATQVKEIAEMDWLIDDINANGLAATPTAARERAVPEFSAP